MRLLNLWIGVPEGTGVAVEDIRGTIILVFLEVCHCRAEVNRCRLTLLLAGNNCGIEFRQKEVPVTVTARTTLRKSHIGDGLEADRGQSRQFGPHFQRVDSPLRVWAADENAAIFFDRQRFAPL